MTIFTSLCVAANAQDGMKTVIAEGLADGSAAQARETALSEALREAIRKAVGVDIASSTKMTNFELSETPSYMDNYIAAMFLPHTEIEKFPRLKARMMARSKS